MGLAGLLIVDDAQMARSTLPDTWGVDDLALVLQDKRFTAAGQIDYTLSASDRTNGYTGDVLLVNGALAPVWRAPSQWVRFRLLNGCNARALVLRLGNSLPLLQVANEAGLLAVPVARPSVALGPGERAEVLVDFSAMPAGQEVPLYASTAQGGVLVLFVQIGALSLETQHSCGFAADASPSQAQRTEATAAAGVHCPPTCRRPMPCPRSPFASSARRPCRLA